nr:NADH dehydrogenase subunit 6 [Venus verrucosa]UJH93156.1 NADH dehydrogenase subunit 6 [Venus verrucosa]UJH93182.1 NADH dehydrogenase subunit 6 [Venus verrucosa]UJH93208.1 NADH dehydrogenase subunit 6 [Venus verrucosa]UJH93247.1 NADH dehydrogenase subunit 6 [Venus verrucosa]
MMEMFVLFSVLSVINFSLKFSHPLMLGMGLLMVLLVVTSILIFYGGLYAFCLFMVMVGGVLVVFSYTISLIPYSIKSYSVKEKQIVVSLTDDFIIMLKLLMSGMVVCLAVLFLTMDSEWSVLNTFSEVMYFTADWGVGSVWMGLLLFLIMVFSVSVAGKYKGALLK